MNIIHIGLKVMLATDVAGYSQLMGIGGEIE